MNNVDYEKLGFKCGVEIHQQLEGKKLFCNCPTKIRKDKPDFEIVRRLRASAGETGDVDQAASHEESKAKYFIYQGYDDTTCLVELDEEPPRDLNLSALKTALEVAKMLNCTIVDEIQVMRKTVIDGSNTSGFQRTALIGVDGYLELNGKRIGVPTVCLEEEACQVIKRTDKYDVYNLSRLGIPLIEIGTDPDIMNPQEAMLVSEKLGMILRSTGKVKRGLGTIRQDVNLSIKGHGRIEIKGFQDLRSIPKVIENELKRQIEQVMDGKTIEPHVRKAEADFSTSYLRPMPGADRMYPETDIIKIAPDLSDLEEHTLLDDKLESLQEKYSLPPDMAKMLIKDDVDFEIIAKRYDKIEPKTIAYALTSAMIDVRRKHGKELTIAQIEPILQKVNAGNVAADSILPLMEGFAQNGNYDFSQFEKLGDDKIEQIVSELVKQNKGMSPGALMGKAMEKLRGKVEGKKVMELIKKLS